MLGNVDGLRQAIAEEKDHFWQIRNSEGRPVAFGWTVDRKHPETGTHQARGNKQHEKDYPRALKLETWCQLSDSLRTERKRVLQVLDVVHREQALTKL